MALLATDWLSLRIISSALERKVDTKLNIYQTETKLLEKYIKVGTKYGCNKTGSKLWYCDSSEYKIEEIIPYRDALYARGVGKTREKLDFRWAASMTGKLWSIYLEDPGSTLPKCEEIEDLPPEIFDGMFSKCLQDGKEVQR